MGVHGAGRVDEQNEIHVAVVRGISAKEPSPGDACQSFADKTFPPRPPGVLQFGDSLQPHGNRTRIVIQNPSADTAVSLTLTIEPRQAGCT